MEGALYMSVVLRVVEVYRIVFDRAGAYFPRIRRACSEEYDSAGRKIVISLAKTHFSLSCGNIKKSAIHSFYFVKSIFAFLLGELRRKRLSYERIYMIKQHICLLIWLL